MKVVSFPFSLLLPHMITIPLLLIDNQQEQGTQVIWEKLVCLTKTNHSLDDETIMSSNLSELKTYIALHFHKFMEGKNKRNFYINKSLIQGIDPFMTICWNIKPYPFLNQRDFYTLFFLLLKRFVSYH